ncbi:hypothetical protein D3C87_1718670 [compost metagenome]
MNQVTTFCLAAGAGGNVREHVTIVATIHKTVKPDSTFFRRQVNVVCQHWLGTQTAKQIVVIHDDRIDPLTSNVPEAGLCNIACNEFHTSLRWDINKK